MIWEPFDVEPRLPTLGKYSSFFLQRVRDKYLIFVYAAELTSVLVLATERNRLSLDCVKKIRSKNTVLKLTGNNNCILMNDAEDEMYYLEGTLGDIIEPFGEYNGYKFLTSDGVLSWQRLNQITKCLAMTGITNAMSLLYFSELVSLALFASDDIKNGLRKMSDNILNELNPDWKYFIVRLKDELAKIVDDRIFNSLNPVKEALLLVEPSKILFLKPTPDGRILSKPYSIDFQSDIVVNVMCFEKKSLILIVCESGKMVCLWFDKCGKSFQLKHFWLPEKVTAVVGYEEDVIYLLWSNLDKVYMSTLDDDNEVKNMKIFHNMKRVIHLLRIEDNIVAITIDGCVYTSGIGCVGNQEIKLTSQELLAKMFHSGKVMEKLTEEVTLKEYLIEALNIARREDIAENLCVNVMEGAIVLENKTDCLFRKELWRLGLETKYVKRAHLEIKELEHDILPGGSVTVKYDENKPNGLILFCDALDDVISIVVEFNENETIHEIEDYSAEICEFLKDKSEFIA